LKLKPRAAVQSAINSPGVDEIGNRRRYHAVPVRRCELPAGITGAQAHRVRQHLDHNGDRFARKATLPTRHKFTEHQEDAPADRQFAVLEKDLEGVQVFPELTGIRIELVSLEERAPKAAREIPLRSELPGRCLIRGSVWLKRCRFCGCDLSPVGCQETLARELLRFGEVDHPQRIAAFGAGLAGQVAHWPLALPLDEVAAVRAAKEGPTGPGPAGTMRGPSKTVEHFHVPLPPPAQRTGFRNAPF
jgi:hypothetical protein